MKGIPLTRCVFVAPFANILSEMGAPTTSLLAKFHLPTQPEEKPHHYVPLFPALRFATKAQDSQGLRDLGFLAGNRLSFETLNDRFQTMVHHAPTLYAALQSLCKSVQFEDNVLRVWLERHEHSLRICYANTFPRAEDMPHLEHAQWLQNMMTIYIVRQFAGPQWTPATFAFQAHYRPSAGTLSFWPNTRFLSGQKSTWIDIPASQLSQSIITRKKLVPYPSKQRLQPLDTDIVNTLKLVLLANLDEHVPTIREAAEIVGTSVRSLQRELCLADLTYSNLLDHVRFENAAEMLRTTDAKIIDVSYAAGYTNPTHFARAFHRIAGVTPREFRKKFGGTLTSLSLGRFG